MNNQQLATQQPSDSEKQELTEIIQNLNPKSQEMLLQVIADALFDQDYAQPDGSIREPMPAAPV